MWIVVVVHSLVGGSAGRAAGARGGAGRRREAAAHPSHVVVSGWATPNITQRCSGLANGDAVPLATLEPERSGRAGEVELVALAGSRSKPDDEAAQQPGGRRTEDADSQNCST